MLVLRTSNFQGATIRSIVPRHKRSIVFISHHQIFFHALVQKINLISLNFLRCKPRKANVEFEEETDKTPLIQFELFTY